MPCVMRDVTLGSALASATRIIVEELLTKRCRAGGTATRPAPASTSTIWTKRWEAAVPTTAEGPTGAVRQVHSTIFKISRGSRNRAMVGQTRATVRHTRAGGMIVRGPREVRVTRQQGEILVSADLPSG